MTYKMISTKLRIPMATCSQSLRRFENNGCVFIKGRTRNGKPLHLRKLQPEVVKFLLSQQTLERWSGAPLIDRCRMLREEMNVSVNISSLWSFY